MRSIHSTNLAQLLLTVGNLHSATAVGMGLERFNFQCPPPWHSTWDVINPEGDFAGCKSFMDGNHCLPCIMPYLQDPSSNLDKIFQFTGYFGRDLKHGQDAAARKKRFGQGDGQKICYEEISALRTHGWWDVWKFLSIQNCFSRK